MCLLVLFLCSFLNTKQTVFHAALFFLPYHHSLDNTPWKRGMVNIRGRIRWQFVSSLPLCAGFCVIIFPFKWKWPPFVSTKNTRMKLSSVCFSPAPDNASVTQHPLFSLRECFNLCFFISLGVALLTCYVHYWMSERKLFCRLECCMKSHFSPHYLKVVTKMGTCGLQINAVYLFQG